MQAIPAPGDVIASRFRVETELGRGGMGVVLRGRDETNGRTVAIKVLLPEAISHPEAVPRFVNEARAARELTSENAVRVYEAGALPWCIAISSRQTCSRLAFPTAGRT